MKLISLDDRKMFILYSLWKKNEASRLLAHITLKRRVQDSLDKKVFKQKNNNLINFSFEKMNQDSNTE